MFGQIGIFLVDTVFTFFVFLLLARFMFQWLRAPFRNPAATPVRRSGVNR